MRLSCFATGLALAALAGCAAMPDELAGDYGGPAPSGATDADIGAPVRWGGRLLAVIPQAERSCFEILSRPLTEIARPVAEGRRSGRRFLACRAEFADPAAYPVDGEVTVVGELTGFETRPVGEYDYRYPVVRLDAIHAWPERRELDPDPLAPPSWWYYHRYGHGYPYYR